MEKTQKTLMEVVERARGSRSVRSIAPAAGMSEGRWRQIAKGSMRSGGVEVPVTAPPETLARMVLAVDLTREDVADVAPEDVDKCLLGIEIQEHWHRVDSGREAALLEKGESVSISSGAVTVDVDEEKIGVAFTVPDGGRLGTRLSEDDLVGAAFVARSTFLDEVERTLRLMDGGRSGTGDAEVRRLPFPVDEGTRYTDDESLLREAAAYRTPGFPKGSRVPGDQDADAERGDPDGPEGGA